MHQSANRIFGLKPDAGSTRECIGYERWVSDLDELDGDQAIDEAVAVGPSELSGQTRLSSASRAQDGQKTGVNQKAAQFTHFLFAADEGGKPRGDAGGSGHHQAILVPRDMFRPVRTVTRTQLRAWPASRRKSGTTRVWTISTAGASNRAAIISRRVGAAVPKIDASSRSCRESRLASNPPRTAFSPGRPRPLTGRRTNPARNPDDSNESG